MYKEFVVIEKVRDGKDTVSVVTKEDEVVIAIIPTHLKHQKVVAEAIAESLTKSKFALEDLI